MSEGPCGSGWASNPGAAAWALHPGLPQRAEWGTVGAAGLRGETALCSSGTVRAEKPSQEGVGGASCRLEALAWPVVHHAALCR